MDTVPQPKPIDLNADEEALLQQFDFQPATYRDTYKTSSKAVVSLMHSLLERKAIPEIRRRYLTDPELNIGGHGNSRKEIFENNGSSGDNMLRHPNFLKYLKYFLYGLDLPSETITQFRQILIDDVGTSTEVHSQLLQFARSEARRLRAPDLHEEFFKLALECEVPKVARSVRDAVLAIK